MSIFGTADEEEKSVSLMADFILKVLTDILKGCENTERRELFRPLLSGLQKLPIAPQGFHFPSLSLTQDKMQEIKGAK